MVGNREGGGTEVGQSGPDDGSHVVAIFEFSGREPFGVFTAGGAGCRFTLVKHVYSVTEFV